MNRFVLIVCLAVFANFIPTQVMPGEEPWPTVPSIIVFKHSPDKSTLESHRKSLEKARKETEKFREKIEKKRIEKKINRQEYKNEIETYRDNIKSYKKGIGSYKELNKKIE